MLPPFLFPLSLACVLLLGGCVSQPHALVAPNVAQSSSVSSSTAATNVASSAAATASAPASEMAPAPVGTATPLRRDPRLYPDPRLTPGDVLRVTAEQVSVPGYASKVRNVSVAEKRAVFTEYGLGYPQAKGAYECDHFIPLCLGGSNSVENLWPEPAPQFHWKDGLEVYLWREVRAGTITLAHAQDEMRSDWYGYWVQAGRPASTADADVVAAHSAATPASPPHAAVKTEGATVVGWSVSGARYHYLTCESFGEIKPANRRTGTVAEARAAGKTPCRVCRPPE